MDAGTCKVWLKQGKPGNHLSSESRPLESYMRGTGQGNYHVWGPVTGFAGVGVLVLGALLAGVAMADVDTSTPPASQDASVPEYVFLARADNPVDALAAGAIAGPLGAHHQPNITLTRSADAAEARPHGPDLPCTTTWSAETSPPTGSTTSG